MFHFSHQISESGFLGLSATAWGAIATFLVVIAALFQEWIKDIWNKAELKMEIIAAPPDMHKIMIGLNQSVMPSIYIRIRVTHVGGKVAEGVEIMVTNFWAVSDDGKKTKMPHFLPLNLKWSHFSPPVSNLRVPIGLFRFCDFGSIRPLKIRSSGDDKCLLVLDTIVQPNPVGDDVSPTWFGPEKYEFELMLTGDNTKVITKRWSLEFANEWSDDEKTMLNNIKIIEVK